MLWPRLCPGVQNKAVSAWEAASKASVMGVLNGYTKAKTLTTLQGESYSNYRGFILCGWDKICDGLSQ
jgi:hypothetical protein